MKLLDKLDSCLVKAPSEFYHPAADGFRALAMLGVMWYHIWQQSWLSPRFEIFGIEFDFTHVVRSGYLFVDIFLLLSGFLLFLPYAKSAFCKTPSPSIGAFYKKRVARILPPYYLCILVLFISAVIHAEYYTRGEMARDILSHLTFTQVFFTDTYLFTHLNVSLWTIAIEVQFYILFPFIARAFKRLPVLTYAVMVLISYVYRTHIVAPMEDTQMYLNQLPAMLDVYANGMLASYAYVSIARNYRPNKAVALLSTIAMVFIMFAIHDLFKGQTDENGYTRIRLGQMERRYAMSFYMSMILIFSSLSITPVKFIFSNRVMRFLSAVSFEAYIWHSVIALKLKAWRIPAYIAKENPQMNGEVGWQWKYTILCFVLSIAIGAFLTYAYEKPLAKLFLRQRNNSDQVSSL